MNGNSNQPSAETITTTLSTIVSPYSLDGKRASVIDVRSLPLITQGNVNVPFNNFNYDSPDPRLVSCVKNVNNYVNNNHLIQNCGHKDKDGYELPVNHTLIV